MKHVLLGAKPMSSTSSMSELEGGFEDQCCEAIIVGVRFRPAGLGGDEASSAKDLKIWSEPQ